MAFNVVFVIKPLLDDCIKCVVDFVVSDIDKSNFVSSLILYKLSIEEILSSEFIFDSLFSNIIDEGKTFN